MIGNHLMLGLLDLPFELRTYILSFITRPQDLSSLSLVNKELSEWTPLNISTVSTFRPVLAQWLVRCPRLTIVHGKILARSRYDLIRLAKLSLRRCWILVDFPRFYVGKFLVGDWRMSRCRLMIRLACLFLDFVEWSEKSLYRFEFRETLPQPAFDGLTIGEGKLSIELFSYPDVEYWITWPLFKRVCRRTQLTLLRTTLFVDQEALYTLLELANLSEIRVLLVGRFRRIKRGYNSDALTVLASRNIKLLQGYLADSPNPAPWNRLFGDEYLDMDFIGYPVLVRSRSEIPEGNQGPLLIRNPESLCQIL
jgi:hypothetical protein